MIALIILIISGFILSGIRAEIKAGKERKALFAQYYKARPFITRRWYREFLDTNKVVLRPFLALFCQCYGLPEKEVCYLSPDDRLDKMEKFLNCSASKMRAFDRAIQEQYGLSMLKDPKLNKSGLTLGELFSVVSHSQSV